MQLIARQIDTSKCPTNLRSYLGQSFVTVGKSYVVYAIAVFEATIFAQIIDDQGYPSWRPFWLFEVVDPTPSKDWICNMFHDDPCLVLGPEFIAGSQAQYSAMVELERAQVDQFWMYVEALKSHASDQ